MDLAPESAWVLVLAGLGKDHWASEVVGAGVASRLSSGGRSRPILQLALPVSRVVPSVVHYLLLVSGTAFPGPQLPRPDCTSVLHADSSQTCLMLLQRAPSGSPTTPDRWLTQLSEALQTPRSSFRRIDLAFMSYFRLPTVYLLQPQTFV